MCLRQQMLEESSPGQAHQKLFKLRTVLFYGTYAISNTTGYWSAVRTMLLQDNKKQFPF